MASMPCVQSPWTESNPNLTEEERWIAMSLLSIPGSFINVGSVKAVKNGLRRFPKDELWNVFLKMAVKRDNEFFIGLLCNDGATNIFYKSPPSMVKNQALEYYGTDFTTYNDLYFKPVRTSNCILNPEEWIRKMSSKSPFLAAL